MSIPNEFGWVEHNSQASIATAESVSGIRLYALPIRPHVGAALAASRACEPGPAPCGWGAKQHLQRKPAIFQLMPSVEFESNGGSSYDHECSYCDAAIVRSSFVRLHELARFHLNHRTSAKYSIDRDQLAVGRNSQMQREAFRIDRIGLFPEIRPTE